MQSWVKAAECSPALSCNNIDHLLNKPGLFFQIAACSSFISVKYWSAFTVHFLLVTGSMLSRRNSIKTHLSESQNTVAITFPTEGTSFASWGASLSFIFQTFDATFNLEVQQCTQFSSPTTIFDKKSSRPHNNGEWVRTLYNGKTITSSHYRTYLKKNYIHILQTLYTSKIESSSILYVIMIRTLNNIREIISIAKKAIIKVFFPHKQRWPTSASLKVNS